jgi:ABC-type antimicrobial peptide transport system permease subunit
MNAELFTVIAMIGLVLSAAGVFSVVSLAVAARCREIGIRMAIGAGRMSVTRAVVGPIGGSLLVGLGLGLVGAFGATQTVRSLLWGVTPADPLSLGLGVGVLVVTVLAALGVPLRRALAVDPAAAFRAE